MGYLLNLLGRRSNNPIIGYRRDPRRTLTYKELQELARQAGLVGRGRMRKLELAAALDARFAALRIAICWRAHKARQSHAPGQSLQSLDTLHTKRLSLSPKRPVSPLLTSVNAVDDATGQEIDPITLDCLEKPIFVHRAQSNKCVKYSLETLVQYLTTSQIFKDPVTGVEFTDADLQRIDAAATEHGLEAPSVHSLKHSQAPQETRQQENLVAALEREAGVWVDVMLRIIQADGVFHNASYGAHYFNRQLIPQFLYTFDQLVMVDVEAADIALSQWAQFLTGPENRPTYNPYGFLGQTLGWLNIIREREIAPRLAAGRWAGTEAFDEVEEVDW